MDVASVDAEGFLSSVTVFYDAGFADTPHSG